MARSFSLASVPFLVAVAGAMFLSGNSVAHAADAVQQSDAYAADATVQPPARKHFWSGDWYLQVGAAGFIAPKFEGSNKYRLMGEPMISIGRQGESTRFSSRNDNMSYALIDRNWFRAGVTGKLLFKRDADIHGLKDTKFGGEVGGFIDVYPTDWMRFHAEVRQGIRAHHGVVADIAADAFYDVTPKVRISGGPRLTLASKNYFKTYYGVDAEDAGLSDELADRLEAWMDAFDAIYEEDDEARSRFPDAVEQLAWEAEGAAIVEAIRGELGPGWTVTADLTGWQEMTKP